MDQKECSFLSDLRKKEEKVWEQLYERYYTSLCNYISGLVHDGNAAADLVQKVFSGLWERNPVFSTIKLLRAYLYRSARNAAITWLEHERAERKIMEVCGLYFRENFSSPDDLTIMSAKEEMVRKLYQCIEKLPEQQRRIMLLSCKGMSVKQIARELNVSVNTVKTQKKRAYTALKNH